MTQLTEKALKNGEQFEFDNDQWCIENESDDLKGMEVMWNDRAQRFFIWFGARIIKDPKTFRALKANVDLLCHRHNMKQKGENN